MTALRHDWNIITEFIAPQSKVLDIGCERGGLLHRLKKEKQIDARGLELHQDNVNRCIADGLAVVQGDASKDLAHYPKHGFDYVILSQTLQTLPQPKVVLRELARIGKKIVIAIPNFGYWRIRWDLLIRGQMPKTSLLSADWYDTPNIHFCTLTDFMTLAQELKLTIDTSALITRWGVNKRKGAPRGLDNWRTLEAVFLLHK